MGKNQGRAQGVTYGLNPPPPNGLPLTFL